MAQTALGTATRVVVSAMSILVTNTFAATIVVDFEDLTLAADSAVAGDENELPFTSRGVTFNRTWNHEFGCCPGAWAYSNKTDLTTAGHTNSHSAYVLPAGGGYGGSANYAVANDNDFDDAVVTMPGPSRIEGMYVTNTTYAYLAVVDGDDGAEAHFVKGPFADGDWFKLDVLGVDAAGQETGQVEIYLADYRDGQSAAISDWSWVDLTSLGEGVSALEFELSSSDTGMFGMNTPSYFAIDELTIVPVPEPGSLFLALSAVVLLVVSVSRRTLRRR
jgi:hypothetical protein